jgi:HD-like signal output (HDOD) protein
MRGRNDPSTSNASRVSAPAEVAPRCPYDGRTRPLRVCSDSALQKVCATADREHVIDLIALSDAAMHLEPLPSSVMRLVALVTKGNVDLGDVVGIVQYDQALTASVLRTANSSWSGVRTEITTAKDAVVRLGSNQVLALALRGNVRGRMQPAIPAYDLAEGVLWRHSVAASLAAEALGVFAKVRLPAETATAALLHDIGKLVLARFFNPLDVQAVRRAHEMGVSPLQSEREILGADHAELGGLIVQAWGLPEMLVSGVAFHHAPEEASSTIAYGVYVADVVAKRTVAEADDAGSETFVHALGALGITTGVVDDVCNLVGDRLGALVNDDGR